MILMDLNFDDEEFFGEHVYEEDFDSGEAWENFLLSTYSLDNDEEEEIEENDTEEITFPRLPSFVHE